VTAADVPTVTDAYAAVNGRPGRRRVLSSRHHTDAPLVVTAAVALPRGSNRGGVLSSVGYQLVAACSGCGGGVADVDEQVRAALTNARYPRSSTYEPRWLIDNLMGPHPLWLAESLTQVMPIHADMRVLDLGCGSALSDWPRGQIRLARPAEQVSRAEFKLEELFLAFPLSIPTGRTALDLGASPGGWTRIIRSHGLCVTAVDPGDLAPAIAADRLVMHARTTAGHFLESSTEKFDLIVNDMRMDAVRTAEVMLDAHSQLKRDGQVIVTFKLGVADPTNLLGTARQTLSQRYTIRFIRQLHHNRHEVTVVATPN